MNTPPIPPLIPFTAGDKRKREKTIIGPGHITWLAIVALCLLVTVVEADLSVMKGALILSIATCAWMFPAMNAEARRHRNRLPIYLLTLLLGLTIIGWIIALIWSYTADIEPEVAAS